MRILNTMKTYRHVSFVFALLFAAQLASVAEPLTLGEHGTQRELFVDGHLIATMTGGAKQFLHKPEPREVVFITDAPWEGNTSAYYTIFRDGDLFRMYYRASHWDTEAKKETHREVTCYAESRDGIHWVKPKLGLFEFNGSKENNIVLDGLGTHCFVAFKDGNPNCPPESRYKGISRGRPIGKTGLYIFESPDGIRWKLTRDEPVITEGAFDSQNLAFWDAHTLQYREYHRTFVNGIRAIMTGTSSDFINWTKPVLLKYQGGIPAQHLYTNAVQPYGRAPHLLIGFPTRYLPEEGQRVEPTLMTSRDGLHFRRWLDPVIPESAPKDRGGNRSNYMAWSLIEIPGRPNHLSVYATEAYYTGPDSRVRRFEYRKDGFVSIRAGAEAGELITKPFALGQAAERLTVNFQTGDGGSIRVAIETPNGQAIAGHTLADCKPLRGDSLQQQVAWKSGDISHLRRKHPAVRLRFELKKADLYSLQFQPWLR
ncbi:MAG: hypothetical protein ACI8QI_000084 [Limisphaerales bacterium]|jgi:hypothetical protein